MAVPFAHLDAPTLIGSFPVVPAFSGGTPTILPRVLKSSASILGARREPTAGYDVSGKSLFLSVDGVQYPVSFVGGGNLTLDDVVTQINTAVGTDVAFKDNRFLRILSPTTGETSSLELATDPASSPTDVFFELGLFSGTISVGGEPEQAQHVDPDRQIASPGQLSQSQGEDFRAEVFNRNIFQLAINSDLNYGLIGRKRQAQLVQEDLVIGAPVTGFTINDTVYVGQVTTPTEVQLEALVALVDTDGNEVVLEQETVLNSSESFTFSVNPDSGAQQVQWVGAGFVAGDASGDFYLRSNDAGMGALQNVNLKIVGVINGDNVVIRNVDPATGAEVPLSLSVSDGEKIQIVAEQIKATQILDAPAGSRVENVTDVRANETITRIEKNNRIFCAGATFTTNVEEGDVVEITGHSVGFPYTNNGLYRVSQIIDDETLELITDGDWGPTLLNPTGSPLGDAEVRSDGFFYTDPHIDLNTTLPAGTYQLRYKKQSTLKGILDAVDSLGGGIDSGYGQEADDRVQATLLQLLGPSVTDFDQVLYGDRRRNVEDLYFKVHREHYTNDELPAGGIPAPGKHKDIRPDTVDMFSDVAGTTVIVRGAPADSGVQKFQVRDSSNVTHFSITETGEVLIEEMGGSEGLKVLKDGASEIVAESDGAASDSQASVIARGFSNNARGALIASGAHTGFTGIEPGDGAAILRMISDNQAANPKTWDWVAQAGAAIIDTGTTGVFKLDVGDDGTGTQVNARISVDVLGQTAIGGLTRLYPGAFPTALRVFQEVGSRGLVIDGDDTGVAGCDIHFVNFGAAPTADENVTQMGMSQTGEFKIRSKDDGFANLDSYFTIFFPSASLGLFGVDTLTSVPHLGSRPNIVQTNSSFVLGDSASFATSDEGLGAGPGVFPAGADMAGEKLIWLDSTSSYIVASQDGSGRINKYWNAFRDGGTGNHHYVRFDEPAIREEWTGSGTVGWHVAPDAVANNDPITWQLVFEVQSQNQANRDPIANVPSQLTFDDPNGTDHLFNRMAAGVRTSSLIGSMRARGELCTNWGPFGSVNTTLSFAATCLVVDEKHVWAISASGGTINMQRVDTRGQSLSVGTHHTLAQADFNSADSAVKVGDYIYILGPYQPGIQRWMVVKVNVSDPENPTIVSDVNSPTASTVTTWGIHTDGIYLYFVSRVASGDTHLAVKVDANTGSDAAPTIVNEASLDLGDVSTVVSDGQVGVAFAGNRLYYIYYDAVAAEVHVREAITNALTGSNITWNTDLNVLSTGTNPGSGGMAIISDGVNWWAAMDQGASITIRRAFATTLGATASITTGGTPTGIMVDDRALYLTDASVNKHNLVEEIPDDGANYLDFIGINRVMDADFMYSNTGTTFYRTVRQK